MHIVFSFPGIWMTYVWMYDSSCIFYFLAYEWFWSHRIWQNIFVILQDLVNALYVPKFWGDSITQTNVSRQLQIQYQLCLENTCSYVSYLLLLLLSCMLLLLLLKVLLSCDVTSSPVKLTSFYGYIESGWCVSDWRILDPMVLTI